MKKNFIRLLSASAASLALVSVLCIGSYAAMKYNGVIPSDEYIGVEKAKEIALSHAGINANDAWFEDAEMDRERGVAVYEMEFYANNVEYDYEVNAESGSVLKAKVEGRPIAPAPEAPAYIGADAAKEIALSHAELSAADVRFEDVELDREKGIAVYELEFRSGGVEYDYKIDALSGSVLKAKVEGRPIAPAPEAPAPEAPALEAPASGTLAPANPISEVIVPQAPAPEAPAYIGADAAKEIALSHAELSAADVRFEDVELDREKGKAVYELEFRSGSVEYDYEIDAISGQILDYERELDD